ncbi:MAG: hypothetical protein ABI193_15935, partial [Minicystis sp.]
PLKAAQNRLFQLVQAAPEHMSLCAEVLDSKYWGDLWQPFLALIWKFSRGGDGSDPVAAKLGAVDLLRRWAAPFKGDSGELPSDLGFLLELSQLALLDESAAVANRAAYAITGYAAHARSPYTTRLVSGALRRMAVDPRLGVRGGAAYAGKKLPLMDVAEETRAVGLEIDEALEKDPYAIIQRQRRFGELDGNHPPE